MKDIVQIDDRFAVAKFDPSPDALRSAAKEGFRSVINMREPGEEGATPPEEEREAAEAAGLAYLHYAVPHEGISEALVDDFRRQASDLPKPALVHCAVGKRAAALVMMEVGSERGMSGDEVIEQTDRMGFKLDLPELESLVRNYVDSRHAR